jgi:hypothetical protein
MFKDGDRVKVYLNDRAEKVTEPFMATVMPFSRKMGLRPPIGANDFLVVKRDDGIWASVKWYEDRPGSIELAG